MSTVVFLTTAGSIQSWSVPADFNTASNTVEGLGSGGTGANGTTSGGGGGGAGGTYGKITNWSGSGSINYFVDKGGTASDTNFNSAGGLADLIVPSGKNASGSTGGLNGGAATSTTGLYTPVSNLGGNGGSGDAAAGGGGGGGGGSAGPNGVGTSGATATSSTGGNGGKADGTLGAAGGTGGAPGVGGNPGSVVNDWTQTSPVVSAGPGSGAGGGGGQSGHNAHAGGAGAENNYSPGGAGGGSATGSGTPVQGSAGGGSQGIIVITYAPNVGTLLTIMAIAPSEMLTVGRTDVLGVNEWSASFLADVHDPVEILSSRVLDIRAADEFLSSYRSDSMVSGEFLVSGAATSAVPVEFKGAILLSTDSIVPLEFRSIGVFDLAPSIEFGRGSVVDALLLNEGLGRRLVGGYVLLDTLATLRNDGVLSQEFSISGARFDSLLLQEALASKRVDVAALLENLQQDSIDNKSLNEFLAQASYDARAALESVQRVVADARAASEVAARVACDNLLSAEWQGIVALGVTVDAFARLEWLGSPAILSSASIESLALGWYDARALSEVSGNAVVTLLAPIEIVGRLQQDALLALENPTTSWGASPLPSEFVAQVYAGWFAPVAWARDPNFDHWVPSESLSLQPTTINPLYILTSATPRNLVLKGKGRLNTVTDTARNLITKTD